jgi:hypothetical protein
MYNNTIKETKNQRIDSKFSAFISFISYPSLGANNLKISGLKNAKTTAEEACNPNVFENASIVKPKKKLININVTVAISIGSNKINKGYNIGYIPKPISKLFNINT